MSMAHARLILSQPLTTQDRVAELRAALIEQHWAVHRHHYLQALCLGEEPELLPKTLDRSSRLFFLALGRWCATLKGRRKLGWWAVVC